MLYYIAGCVLVKNKTQPKDLWVFGKFLRLLRLRRLPGRVLIPPKMTIWRDFSHFWIHDNLTIFYKKSADEQVDFGKSKKGAKIQIFQTFQRYFSNSVMSVWVLKPIKRNWDRFHRLNCKMAITFKASNSHHHIRFTTLKLIFLLDSLTAQFTFKNALFNGPF